MHNSLILRNARNKSRTCTALLPGDFKSPVSTIPPSEQKTLAYCSESLALRQKKFQGKILLIVSTEGWRGKSSECSLTVRESGACRYDTTELAAFAT